MHKYVKIYGAEQRHLEQAARNVTTGNSNMTDKVAHSLEDQLQQALLLVQPEPVNLGLGAIYLLVP